MLVDNTANLNRKKQHTWTVSNVDNEKLKWTEICDKKNCFSDSKLIKNRERMRHKRERAARGSTVLMTSLHFCRQNSKEFDGIPEKTKKAKSLQAEKIVQL